MLNRWLSLGLLMLVNRVAGIAPTQGPGLWGIVRRVDKAEIGRRSLGFWPEDAARMYPARGIANSR